MQDDAGLTQALVALAPQQAGDWDDVLQRSQAMLGRRRRRRKPVLAIAFAAVLLMAGAAWAVGSQVFGWFSVSRSPVEAPSLPAAAGYVSGRALHLSDGSVQQLSRPLRGSLLGHDAALVVPSPDGRYVAYHAWTGGSTIGTPLLVLHDIATGSDRVLARGAQTLAWSSAGRIAYFQASRPRYDGSNGAYVGEVVVRTLGGPSRAWTRRPGDYQVLAWAGRTLLVGIPPCFFPNCRHDPAAGVYALSSAGTLRPLHLATHAQGDASRTALSPDGRYAVGIYSPVPGEDTPSPFVRIVRIEDGHPTATLDLLRPLRHAGLRASRVGSLLGAAWRKGEIALTFDSALVLLRMRGETPTIEEILRIPSTALPNRYGVSLGIPFLTGPKNGKVIVTARGSVGVVAVLACSRAARRCVRGHVFPTRRWFAVVANPSRP